MTRKGWPSRISHREEGAAFVRAGLEGLDDVRVAQPRGEPRLIDEHGDEGRAPDELRAKLLHGQQLVKAARTPQDGERDDAHAAAPELHEDAVFAEVSA